MILPSTSTRVQSTCTTNARIICQRVNPSSWLPTTTTIMWPEKVLVQFQMIPPKASESENENDLP
jgi:hypothetical protein